ncbi:MAG TPA: hypothetical protein VFF98_04410 [Novosphingobium sp.]|nr:hypothetical protein [Novosphingobium sp.]
MSFKDTLLALMTPLLAPFLTLALAGGAHAEGAAKPAATAPVAEADTAEWPEAWFEIFKLAPGKQEAFVRRIALEDEAEKAVGRPPIELYFHEDGADWDVLLLKPEPARPLTEAEEAVLKAKRRALGMPSGPAYFVDIRQLIAAHTDTKAEGPISAAQWLARLDSWRLAHPAPAPGR